MNKNSRVTVLLAHAASTSLHRRGTPNEQMDSFVRDDASDAASWLRTLLEQLGVSAGAAAAIVSGADVERAVREARRRENFG